ncbi:MAG: hypothetical protein AAFX58_10170 [Pseudomonadota bacterium]
MLRQLTRLLSRKEERAQKPPPAARPRSFAAVSVRPSATGACRAAKLVTGQRFLTDQAPMLPLAGCDRASCDCRYVHYSDRRQEQRRDIDVGISSRFFFGEERRQSTGRRATDRKG